MHEIQVRTISSEEAEHGVAELWRDGEQIAFTHLDRGELVLRISPRSDGTPLVIEVRSLRNALAAVDRSLASY